MSIGLHPDVAATRDAADRLRASSYTRTGMYVLTAGLLDAVAEQMDFAAVMADESTCDAVTECWPTWTAALDLARAVLR